MSTFLVGLCYGSALVVALGLLWYFGPARWYWHLLSSLAALALGMYPMSGSWNTPAGTLAIGWVFIVLFVWAIAAPVFALSDQHPHRHHRAQ